MGCGPSQGGKEEKEERTENCTAHTINDLNSMSSEKFVKIVVHNLTLRKKNPPTSLFGRN